MTKMIKYREYECLILHKTCSFHHFKCYFGQYTYLRRRFVYLLHGIFIYIRLNIRDVLLKKSSVFQKESNQRPSWQKKLLLNSDVLIPTEPRKTFVDQAKASRAVLSAIPLSIDFRNLKSAQFRSQTKLLFVIICDEKSSI